MIPGAISIDLRGNRFELLPDRALWWPARRTLIVADVHLGKDAAFRHAGVPVPMGGDEKDLLRLNRLLTNTAAERLIVLGDLVHARTSHQAELSEAVRRWRSTHENLPILLVRGNHDRRAGVTPADWDIQEVEELFNDDGVILAHEPRTDPRGPVLAGHVHPVVAVRDFDRTVVRAPCFVLDGEDQLTLPAFGTFTGGYRAERASGRRLFMTSGRTIVEIV